MNQDAARQTFIDIADGSQDPEDVDKVLSLTDNMPLSISLLAHLADSEGCSTVLSRWNSEKTSLISDGYDRRSNLDLSISLSLSSPRIKSVPHSQELLSLLSMLPDGLSDVELLQSDLPIDNILRCKATLIMTTLAYDYEHQRLKVLVPIREYMEKNHPPGDHLVCPLLIHFHELLELYMTSLSGRTVSRISSNYSNIQNVLRHGLKRGHPDLKNSIYSACNLQTFNRLIHHGSIPLLSQIHDVLPHVCDHQLEVHFITEVFASWRYYPIPNPDALVSRALKNLDQFEDENVKCVLSVQSWFL